MSECVGLVGMGLMGQAFSHNLLQAGFKVQGFDVDEQRMRQLNERGGTPVDSPAAAARGARWIITSLPNSDIVREVALGAKGIAEGLVLGTKAGMQTDNLLKVLQDAACSSKTMIDKGPKMLKGDFTPEGHVKTSLKDARLALEQGARLGAPMLVTSLWTQLQQAAYHQGLADVDSSAFIEVLRGMAGLPKRG